MFEVFHYESPDQRYAVPRNSDIGGHHVGLYVDDIDAAIAHLKEAGVEVFDGPTASQGAAREWRSKFPARRRVWRRFPDG